MNSSVVIAIIAFLAWLCMSIVNSQLLDIGCVGHLQRASYTNDINVAKDELQVAIGYAERHGLTSGYTSLMWNTPDEDVAFWYTNLKNSYKDLQSVAPDASNMEKSNMLLKLKESLVHHGKEGDKIIYPEGLEIYPYNKVYAFWGLISFIWGVLGIFMLWSASRYRSY
jgi:hypothetical protein